MATEPRPGAIPLNGPLVIRWLCDQGVAQRERIAALEEALRQIAALEVGEAAMIPEDWSHMSGPDTCSWCEEAHRIALAAIGDDQERAATGAQDG